MARGDSAYLSRAVGGMGGSPGHAIIGRKFPEADTMQPAYLKYYRETDYLAAEREAAVRHEYVAGEVLPWPARRRCTARWH